jgi:hypothetical protein
MKEMLAEVKTNPAVLKHMSNYLEVKLHWTT